MRVTVTALLLTLLLATGVAATEFIETWDDPLGDWRNRWVAQNTNMQNIYVCTGSTTDENTRGNNPCGLWICDGTPDNICTIDIDPGFGGQIRTWEIDIQAVAPNITLEVYDTLDVVILAMSANRSPFMSARKTPASENSTGLKPSEGASVIMGPV